jgi:hypothetical protein
MDEPEPAITLAAAQQEAFELADRALTLLTRLTLAGHAPVATAQCLVDHATGLARQLTHPHDSPEQAPHGHA